MTSLFGPRWQANSERVSPGAVVTSLNSYAILTSVNGQVTLVPSVLSALPTAGAFATPTPPPPPPRRQPVAIAPKPTEAQVVNFVRIIMELD